MPTATRSATWSENSMLRLVLLTSVCFVTGACSCAEREPSEPLEAAASEIGAQASGYLATEPVEVISEEKASELHLKTARAATVTGRVLDESESPVPGALVEINRSHAVTDEAGAFVIDGLPWGEEVFAQADGGDVGSGRIGPISPPADDLVIRVRKHGRLSGRVLDSDTGQAIDAFCVDSGYESPVPGGRNFQNGDGAFHWDGLEEGDVQRFGNGRRLRTVRGAKCPYRARQSH